MSVIMPVAGVLYPFTTEAGILSGIFHFLSGTETNAQVNTPPSAAVLPLLESQQNPSAGADNTGNMGINDDVRLQMTDDAALVAPHNPIGVFVDDIHDEIIVYTVKSGDSPGGIAKRFGISLSTLLWANDIKNASFIRVGDELVILPVSGVQYQIKKGDTIESIAKRFKPKNETDITSVINDILQYNGLAINELLEVGATIIIPDGEIATAPSAKPSGGTATPRNFGLPEYIGYFLRPVIGGRNVRATKSNPHGLHGYNGVDLGVSYGAPISASAEGTVIRATSSGWNGGYGNYVIITHPNGTQTLYAHMSAVLVAVGQRVAQGAKIGFVGSSGNSTGPHVHFEIRGAKNPF